jgi:small subunit ribosomal protein S11
VHVQATFNNTIVTISDQEGNTIAWSSAGSLGFRGSRKGTPFAAQQAALTAANKANESGLRVVEVRVSGPGSGRESAVRALSTAGIEVRAIKDVTPIRTTDAVRPKSAGSSRARPCLAVGQQGSGSFSRTKAAIAVNACAR